MDDRAAHYWLQRVVADVNDRKIALYNAHFIKPVRINEEISSSFNIGLIKKALRYDTTARDRQINRMLSLLRTENRPFIVAGDFNMAAHTAMYATLAAHLTELSTRQAPGWERRGPFRRFQSCIGKSSYQHCCALITSGTVHAFDPCARLLVLTWVRIIIQSTPYWELAPRHQVMRSANTGALSRINRGKDDAADRASQAVVGSFGVVFPVSRVRSELMNATDDKRRLHHEHA